MGTGDGRFVLAEAKANPGAFFVGVDAVAGAMAETSRRGAAKPARGGAPNAMFLCAAAEALPGQLAGAFDAITVNFPWGSLLRALALPEEAVLAKLAALGRPGASFTSFVNVQPLRDPAQAAKLGLAGASLLDCPDAIVAAFARAGFARLRIDRNPKDQPVTSWGRHLAVSKREVWRLEARVEA